ncbi:MAG: PglZ domain-containing protein [Bacteroidota bacterium]
MNGKILWADDEIEHLRAHVMFLKEKGYDVTTVTNGGDAIDEMDRDFFDIVFLDENMPGLSGLETLVKIKEKRPDVPVVMITKSEEEMIMEDAIGSKIADYLIKPVNPSQILLALKKSLDSKRLVGDKAVSGYRQQFMELTNTISGAHDMDDWMEVYQRLIFWEVELQSAQDPGMKGMLEAQKQEANRQFFKFVSNNYLDWLNPKNEKDAPVLSHTLFKQRIFPHLKDETPLYVIVVDNLRMDQWKTLRPILSDYFNIVSEDGYCAILPTATQYARNALFAGLMPSEIEKIYKDLWLNENDEGSKNQYEAELLALQLKRLGYSKKSSYNKITTLDAGKRLSENFSNLSQNHLNVIVYNFVDMLSHARTDMEVIKELAEDETAYRSLTVSWFRNSPLFDFIKKVAEKKGRLLITTDHGSIRTQEPSQVIGDRNTNSNLRYKVGKNLNFKAKEVFAIAKPEQAYLPRVNVSSTYIFAKEDMFFVYPNNYNQYVNQYRNTFQHGGISMEEMLIPLIYMEPK